MPDIPGSGQESVWDYPRPPRVEPTPRHLVVVVGGVIVAETRGALRVVETAGAPVYYFPPVDVTPGCLEAASGSSWCEWKGTARYWTVVGGDRTVPGGAWSYPTPTRGYEAIRDHVAFYPALMDTCTVDGETARPQPGGFYGGWVTNDIVGPIKGSPGSEWW